MTYVSSQHRTKLIITTNSLHNTGSEDLLGELNDLQSGIWCVWRWLDNDSVAGKQSWDDLAKRQNDGEVPWANSTDNTEWCITSKHDLLVVFVSLLWEGQTKMEVDEADHTLGLHLSELALRAVSYCCLL